MRRADKEINNKKEIESILKECRICHVGFSDGMKPYVLAFNYGYKTGFIYIHCAYEGRKLEMLRKNMNVCVEIDNTGSLMEAQEPCKYGYKYKSIVAFGTAAIIDKKKEKIKAMKIITEHITGKIFDKFREDSLEKIKIIRIKIKKITGKKSGY